MSEPLKRLELRLPANHPVWSLPDGSRSKIVREWLEVGRKLTEIEESLRDITEKLTSTSTTDNTKSIEVTEYTNTHHEFDKNAFLKHFK